MPTYYEQYGKAFSDKQEEKRLERKRKIETDNPYKYHRVTSSWVIRTVLAENLDATVEDISKACKAAGVPASAEFIRSRMTSFKRVYRELLESDQIIID